MHGSEKAICVVVIGRLSAELLEKTRLYSSETRIALAADESRPDVSSNRIDVIGHLDAFSSSG